MSACVRNSTSPSTAKHRASGQTRAARANQLRGAPQAQVKLTAAGQLDRYRYNAPGTLTRCAICDNAYDFKTPVKIFLNDREKKNNINI